jgi:hypothetical protein
MSMVDRRMMVRCHIAVCWMPCIASGVMMMVCSYMVMVLNVVVVIGLGVMMVV